MQVELLRDLFNQALEDHDESSRVGNFWCFADDYSECLTMLKTMMLNKHIQEIAADDCTITRKETGFFFKDPHGGQDTYSFDEAYFLIDLWHKTQIVIPNIIQWPPQEDITKEPL